MSAQSCPTLCDFRDCSRQAPLSMDFAGNSTGVGCHFLLQGSFLTQGSNLCLLWLLRWQADALPLSHLGSPSHSSSSCQNFQKRIYASNEGRLFLMLFGASPRVGSPCRKFTLSILWPRLQRPRRKFTLSILWPRVQRPRSQQWRVGADGVTSLCLSGGHTRS